MAFYSRRRKSHWEYKIIKNLDLTLTGLRGPPACLLRGNTMEILIKSHFSLEQTLPSLSHFYIVCGQSRLTAKTYLLFGKEDRPKTGKHDCHCLLLSPNIQLDTLVTSGPPIFLSTFLFSHYPEYPHGWLIWHVDLTASSPGHRYSQLCLGHSDNNNDNDTHPLGWALVYFSNLVCHSCENLLVTLRTMPVSLPPLRPGNSWRPVSTGLQESDTPMWTFRHPEPPPSAISIAPTADPWSPLLLLPAHPCERPLRMLKGRSAVSWVESTTNSCQVPQGPHGCLKIVWFSQGDHTASRYKIVLFVSLKVFLFPFSHARVPQTGS